MNHQHRFARRQYHCPDGMFFKITHQRPPVPPQRPPINRPVAGRSNIGTSRTLSIRRRHGNRTPPCWNQPPVRFQNTTIPATHQRNEEPNHGRKPIPPHRCRELFSQSHAGGMSASYMRPSLTSNRNRRTTRTDSWTYQPSARSRKSETSCVSLRPHAAGCRYPSAGAVANRRTDAVRQDPLPGLHHEALQATPEKQHTPSEGETGGGSRSRSSCVNQ